MLDQGFRSKVICWNDKNHLDRDHWELTGLSYSSLMDLPTLLISREMRNCSLFAVNTNPFVSTLFGDGASVVLVTLGEAWHPIPSWSCMLSKCLVLQTSYVSDCKGLNSFLLRNDCIHWHSMFDAVKGIAAWQLDVGIFSHCCKVWNVWDCGWGSTVWQSEMLKCFEICQAWLHVRGARAIIPSQVGGNFSGTRLDSSSYLSWSKNAV